MKQWIAISVFLIAAAGCKQGVGQRCQVNSDCSSGLCSNSDPKVCIGGTDTTGDIDATDAPLIDAGVDAAVDAALDSSIDAPVDAP